MAEKMKDAEDRMLASMFQSEPIADDGFSKRVVLRIRRRLWVRRLALPFATVIGGAVSLKPLSELVVAAAKLLTVMPERLFDVPTAWLPQMESVVFGASLAQMVVLAAMLLAAGLLGTRMLIE